MKRWALATILVATVGLLAGCGGPKTVTIKLQDMSFNTKKIELRAGVLTRIVLDNRDKVTHDLSVDTIPVDVTAATESAAGHSHEEGKEPDLHVSVAAGEKGWVEFTPLEAGTFTFYCTVDGHRDHGMEGTLVVK